MSAPIPKERLACACLILENYIYREDFTIQALLPIPNTMLVMDFYNQMLKENPRIRKFLENDVAWITTHGRVVHDKTAKEIALASNQIDDELFNSKDQLQPYHIWRMK